METQEKETTGSLGLTSAEVAERTARGEVNKSREKSGKSYFRIVIDDLFTFFNMIWALIAVLMIAFQSYSNLTFLAVIIPNILIAIIQECRAKHTVEKLSVTTDPRAVVIRDGEAVEIAAEQIVLGDVMRVSMGQQILADAVVVSGLAEANESMLTGESNAIRKSEGDRVLAGSYLVSGQIDCRTIHVGAENYIHKIEKAAKGFKKPASNLFRDLNKLLFYIACLMVPLAVFMYIFQRISTGSVTDSVLQTCGAVIGMIPAGMYLLVTVTLTLSVITLATKRTLVQDMYSIEMLASADVVCLDKTGTITDGTMCVSAVLPLGTHTAEEVGRIMSLIEGSEQSINATSRALIEYFGTADDDPLIDKVPFSSARKYSAATFRGIGTYSVGAPHFVRCEVSDAMEEQIGAYAAAGERVLLLARHEDLAAEEGEPIALIAVSDRIRPNAKETIEKFQSQDVAVKIISGDHAATVAAIAARVGVKNADRYASCETMSDEELVAAADEYTVFGRVTPEQKVLLVKTLKAEGHTVAMTGDGVNDTLALKESNCAIAMADGSEMARKVSQIVLLDSDFGTLPDVVREGRRCINNVRRSSTLFLMKTVLTITLSIVTVITGLLSLFTSVPVFVYPFQPKGLMLLELCVIGIASVLLALEPNNERIEGSFIRTVLKNSIPNAIALIVPVFVVVLLGACGVFESTAQRNVLAMIAVTLAGLANLWMLCIPYTKWRAFVAAGMTVFLALAVLVCATVLSGFMQLGFDLVAKIPGTVVAIALGSMAFAVLVHVANAAIHRLVKKAK